MADLTAIGTVDKTLVTSLADAKSYMVEENPSLVGAYTAINTGSPSSSNAANQQSITTVTYPNLGSTAIGTTLGGIGGWAINRDNGDIYYHIDGSFRPNLSVDDVCEENGFTHAVEGLYKSVLLTSEESEIVKIWETSNDSIEEFFVLGSIHGNIDLDVMIALSEVALGHLAGKKLSDLYDMEGMSKNFFKIIDPYARNRQGADIGPQYRTGIYWQESSQASVVLDFLRQKQKLSSKRIVTEAHAIASFYPAEDYHQKYLEKNPTGYCHIPEKF